MNLDRIKDKTWMTFEEASAIWSVNPETGVLSWLPASGKSGPITFSPACETYHYRRVRYQGRSFAVHRLVWLLCTGKWPEFIVDHINGKRQDNRLSNLRDVPHQVNQMNQNYHREGRSRTYPNRQPAAISYPGAITFEGFERRYQAMFGNTGGRYA